MNHEKYSDLLSIKVLYLNKIDIADDDDIRTGRVYWAKMFRASTWEEILEMSENGRAFMEAARELYNVNMIPKERTMMEAHQRYLDIQNGQRAYYEDVLAEKDNALAEKDNIIAEQEEALLEKGNALLEKEEALAEKDNALMEKDNALMEKDNALMEKEEEIARLRAQIELLGRK